MNKINVLQVIVPSSSASSGARRLLASVLVNQAHPPPPPPPPPQPPRPLMSCIAPLRPVLPTSCACWRTQCSQPVLITQLRLLSIFLFIFHSCDMPLGGCSWKLWTAADGAWTGTDAWNGKCTFVCNACLDRFVCVFASGGSCRKKRFANELAAIVADFGGNVVVVVSTVVVVFVVVVWCLLGNVTTLTFEGAGFARKNPLREVF